MCKDGEGAREEDENSEARDFDERVERDRDNSDCENAVDQRGYLGECDDQVY